MKTFVPFKQCVLKIVLFLAVIASGIISHAQELVFKNSALETGSPAAGSDGATYRFPSVANNVDALVKINGRSSSLVTLTNIDVTSTGYDKAFQPQVMYNNGNVSGAASWWMEFKITFVNKNTTTPVTISTFNATALDIDGDNGNLNEWDAFYSPASYTLENPTNLSVSNLAQMIVGLLTNVGKTFNGTTIDHSGIDTLATNLMVTTKYNSVNTITYRAGGTTTVSSSNTNRQYSVYFKNFNYSSPIITLPVKLESFTANLDGNKVNLKWTTAQEINVSHFTIEKSYDGKNFSDAGLVFAFGNTSEEKNYTFSDNIVSVRQGMIYYRLRSVDNDGKSKLSETRMIRIGKQDGQSISILVYPNPVSNELRITIPNNWQGKKVSYQVVGNNGQIAINNEAASSNQTETINASSLTPGFYIVKVICGNETAGQKIIKQ